MNSLDGEKILNEYECEVEKIANSPELEKIERMRTRNSINV